MFTCKTLDELRAQAEGCGVKLPLTEDLSSLAAPMTVGKHTLANRIAIQPMEGCDGTADGAPGELTIRRYDRFAQSGAALVWFEACAVVREGRANPRQAWLTKDNLDAYKALNDRIRENAVKAGQPVPVIIMQATHSGRYSKPDGVPAPIIAYNNPIFEKGNPIPADRIITDDELYRLEDCMAASAALAASGV